MNKHLLFRLLVLICVAGMLLSCHKYELDGTPMTQWFPENECVDYHAQTLNVSAEYKRPLETLQFTVIVDDKHYYESYDKTEINTSHNPQKIDSSVPRYINGPWFTVEIPASPTNTITIEVAENNTVKSRSLQLGSSFHIGNCRITQESYPDGLDQN